MMFLKKLHLHPILIVFIILSMITGTFIHLFILFSIILLHEAGHYMMARYYNWEIDVIMLWVFGGVMKVDESIDRPIKQEILVTIAGPFQHLVIFVFLYGSSLFINISPDLLYTAHYYNIIILLFNLLPINPLDGGKLLLSTLSVILPFKNSFDWTILFSLYACVCILIFQLFAFSFTLSAFMLFLFLLWENIRDWKYRYYTFLRFLLHRKPKGKQVLLNVPSYFTLMDIFNLFKRNYSYMIQMEHYNQPLEEHIYINKYFQEHRIHDRLDEIWPRKALL